MAAPLATCTKEEQHSVVGFLSSEGVKPIEIYRRMKVQYGDACLSLQQVYEWTRMFMNSINSVTDSTRPVQAHRVVTIRLENRLRRQWQFTRDPALKAEVNRLQRSVTRRLNERRNDQWSTTLESLDPEDQ